MKPETSSLVVRFGAPSDAGAIAALLAADGLPTADLDESQVQLVVASDGQLVIGVIGLEQYGTSALLRSLAVAPHRRGRAVGRALYEKAAELARQHEVTDLYLLTTTARPYFASLGFAEVDRRQVPESIRRTGQFTTLCPSTATCMHKRLEGMS